MPDLKIKNMFCYACQELWEQDFFCKKCSGLHCEDTHELVPNIFWDGSPQDEYVWVKSEPEHIDICMNCCTCFDQPE